MKISSALGKAANAVLGRKGYRLIANDRLYPWQLERGVYFHTFKAGELPPDALKYLDPSNPVLQELRARYQKVASPVTAHSVWKDGFVRPEDLRYFRGDNQYVWQLRGRDMNPLGYALTTYFTLSADRLGLLGKLQEDEAFGLHGFVVAARLVSRDLLDSVNELNFLERHLQISTWSQAKVLDIGAGYGRLAHRAAQAGLFKGLYHCTDAVPESTFLCGYYLGYRGVADRTKVIPLDELDSGIGDSPIDLAINIHSFSECKLPAIDWWLAFLERKQTRYLFMVPNAVLEGGRVLANADRAEFKSVALRHGFKEKVVEPKYSDPLVQEHGVSPTYYHLFERQIS